MKIKFSSDPLVAHETNGLAVSYAPGKRKLSNWRWRILAIIVMSPLLLFLGRLMYGSVWADMPGFVVMEETVLKAPYSGKLTMTVPVGQPVRPGETIAELRNDVLANEYAALQANRKEVQGLTFSRMDGNERSIAAAQNIVRLRKEEYAKISALERQNAATQTEVAAAFANLSAAERDLLAAQNQVAQNQVNDPHLSETKAMLDSLTIKASDAGIVSQVFGKRGEWVTAGSEIANLRLNRPEKIEVFVEPAWAKHATVGSWATLNFLDGYSHRARVEAVNMNAQRIPSDRANPLTVRYHSIVVLLEPEPRLPEQYRVNSLPVNVQFDRGLSLDKLAFWKKDQKIAKAAVESAGRTVSRNELAE